MTFAVNVKMVNGKDEPCYYALDDGVSVGQAGELTMVSERDDKGNPTDFFIYAPGTWAEVAVSKVDDE